MAWFKKKPWYKYNFCNFVNDKINIQKENGNSYQLWGRQLQSIMHVVPSASSCAAHGPPAGVRVTSCYGLGNWVSEGGSICSLEMGGLSCRVRLEQDLTNGQASALDCKRGWEYLVRRAPRQQGMGGVGWSIWTTPGGVQSQGETQGQTLGSTKWRGTREQSCESRVVRGIAPAAAVGWEVWSQAVLGAQGQGSDNCPLEEGVDLF